MRIPINKVPYPLSRIVAALRRRRDEQWMRRWAAYRQQHNVAVTR